MIEWLSTHAWWGNASCGPQIRSMWHFLRITGPQGNLGIQGSTAGQGTERGGHSTHPQASGNKSTLQWSHTHIYAHVYTGSSDGKESACNAGDLVWSLGWEEPLEKGTATHSSILAWRIPWTEEPGRLQSRGLKQLDMTERLSFHFTYTHMHALITHTHHSHRRMLSGLT